MNGEFRFTGIILAGGKSSRMHCDKPFLKLGQKTIIEELISKLEKKFSHLIIIANDVKKYEDLGIGIISDIISFKGPLGGIYTGLVRSTSFHNFVFASDAPFANFDLIDYMIKKTKDEDVIVPRWQNRFEPLHAIYSKRCIEPIKGCLEKDDLKITNFFSKVNVKVIEQEEIEKLDIRPLPFININTKDDYDAVIEQGIDEA